MLRFKFSLTFIQKLILTGVIIFGATIISVSYLAFQNQKISQSLQIARSIVATLSVDDIKSLEVKPSDTLKPQYQRIKNSFKNVLIVNKTVRFVYLYTLQNDRIFFMVDSESENLEDYSPPGLEYTEAHPEYKLPFTDGKERILFSKPDRWGVWTSVLVPVRDNGTGKIIAVFRLDYNAKSLNNDIILEIAEFGILILLLLLTLFFLFQRDHKNKTLQSDIKRRVELDKVVNDNDEKYMYMFNNNPQVMWICNNSTLAFLAVNKAAINKYGYSSEEFLTMNLSQVLPSEDVPAYLRDVKIRIDDFSTAGIWKHLTKNGETIFVEIISHKMIYNDCDARHVLVRDVTDRKKAIDALNDSEEKYRAFFENNTDAMLLISSNGQIISVNQAACKMFGYSTAELITFGRAGIEDLSDNNFSVLLSECNRKGKAFGEASLIRSNGSRFPVEISNSVFKNSEGILHSSMIIRDITKRKDSETALIQSEERYRTIFENVQDVFYKTDIAGIILEMSPSIRFLTDFRSEDLLGKPVTDLYAYPIDRLNFLEKINKDGEVRSYELRIKSQNTKQKFVSINARLIYDADGKPNHIIGSLRDITERKEAEKDIRMFAQSLKCVHEALCITDLSNNMLFVNQSFLDVSGYDLSELIGNHINMVRAPGNELNNGMGIMPSEINGEWQGEQHNKRKDGSEYPVYLSLSIIKDEKGRPIGQIGVATDITERKRTEKELIDAKEKAEESDRLKSAFLANMSHEIRTPMNGILGFAELLKEPLLTGAEQQEYIDIIQKSGSRMLNIINDIVNISKVESGQMELSISKTNLNEQLEYIFTFFKPEAAYKGIELKYKRNRLLQNLYIETDREKLYAVLINLVKNALKFTDLGSIEFGYNIIEKGPNTEIEFFISDTGIGIENHQLEFIFDRFRQGSESLNRNYEGAGLGLAISKAYILMLGGKIWAESKKGEGSTFYFILPHKEDSFISEDSYVTRHVPEYTGKKLNILIAEDDETSGIYINTIVKAIANKISRAKTGLEAVELCRNIIGIDLILMDIKMPEMDGYEATRQIRKFNTRVIIIAQTSFALTGDSDKSLAAGCNDYIAKPYSKTELYQLLQKHFKG